MVNILLKSHFFLFWKDASVFITCGFVFVNGFSNKNFNVLVSGGDFVQIELSADFFNFSIFFRKFIKSKIALYKQNSWLFFKKLFLTKTTSHKYKKRKTPNYLYFLYLYKFNTNKYLEVDYMTLSVVILKKQSFYKQYTYFLRKTFSFKLFALYNYKKIN